MVFGKPDALVALNRIVHPALVVAIRERILSTQRIMNRVVVDVLRSRFIRNPPPRQETT
jgi:hypothetical protein